MEQHEKRKHRRLLCAGLIEVRWTDADGKLRCIVANLDDLSDGGASLALDEMLQPGTEVTLGPREPAVLAVVRYARSTEIGWQVGVEFVAGQHLRPLRGEISHILDPATVGENPKQPGAAAPPVLARDSIACLTLEHALREAESSRETGSSEDGG